MGISHEEETKRLQALQREYGHDYIYQKAYPWRIRIYYGENQLLVRPMMHKSQIMQVEMIWLRQIKDISNAQLIGDTVLEAIEHIRISPIDVRSPVEREEDAIYHATKCKSYNALGRKYLECIFVFYEDGSMKIFGAGHDVNNDSYPYDERSVLLPANTAAVTIGKEIQRQIALMEEYYEARKYGKTELPRTRFETIGEREVSFIAPQDEQYVDEQDYNVGEIYQGYSYSKEGAEESVADMYFGFASELDCDCSEENIKAHFERDYSKLENYICEKIEHPLFDTRVEISNKKMHHVIYLKQMDEYEIFACELYLKVKPAGKRLFAMITKDFEKMVKSSRYEEKQ